MKTIYCKTRRRSLPNDKCNQIAEGLANYLYTNDKYALKLANASRGYTEANRLAYRRIFARIHQLRNAEHRTLDDVFTPQTATAIVIKTIALLQITTAQ